MWYFQKCLLVVNTPYYWIWIAAGDLQRYLKSYIICVIVIFYILTLQKGSDPYIRQPKNNQKINAEVAQFWMENLQFSCAAFACSSLILNGMICYCSMWQKHKRQSSWRIGCGPGFLHQQINLVSWTAVRFCINKKKLVERLQKWSIVREQHLLRLHNFRVQIPRGQFGLFLPSSDIKSFRQAAKHMLKCLLF